MPDLKDLYRLMLNLYPARFREEYAAPLERQFRDEYRDLPNGGARALFWMKALADLAASIPAELFRELRQDVRYGARVYRRRLSVTVLSLVALALAIGATTGVFSVLNALLLRSLPFRAPERLVEVQSPTVSVPSGRKGFYEWRDREAFLKDAASYSSMEMNLTGTAQATRVRMAETTANFFETLGTDAFFGRTFAPDEDLAGHNTEAVISYGLWQQGFGGDPRVLGSTIRLNGTPLTVIGVAPPGFDYPSKTAVWTPTVFEFQLLSKFGSIFWNVVGRVKDGMSIARAANIYETEIRRVRPDRLTGDIRTRARLVPLRDRLAGPVREASLVLLGVVAFVLLIACANVAHLLLSRITERRPEWALRMALGGSRARLIQQLITESTLLTLSAAVAGLAVAQWAARLASIAQPAQLSSQDYTILDWRVLAFVVGIAMFTGLLFGVLPANLIGSIHPADPLRSGVTSHRAGLSAMRNTLIALQAACSLVLVIGAFTMGRGFLKLLGTDLGFRTDHMVTLNVSLMGTPRDSTSRAERYYTEALDALRAVPGVEMVGAVDYLPLMRNPLFQVPFRVDGATELSGGMVVHASSDYFRTLGISVPHGRTYAPSDGADRVAVVNEEFERRAGVGPLVGRQLTRAGAGPRTIIGVVRSSLMAGPASPGFAQVYLPAEQSSHALITFVARVHGDPKAYLVLCREVLQRVDRDVPVYDVETLDQRLATALAQPRFYTSAILFFGGFALLLAIIGVHGVSSHAIAQRTHEIGVRLAVGASPSTLRSMLVRQTLLPVAIGAVAGVAGAITLGRFLEHLIDNAEPVGLWACGGAAVLLAVTAAITVWAASRSIVRLDPMRVLRTA